MLGGEFILSFLFRKSREFIPIEEIELTILAAHDDLDPSSHLHGLGGARMVAECHGRAGFLVDKVLGRFQDRVFNRSLVLQDRDSGKGEMGFLDCMNDILVLRS